MHVWTLSIFHCLVQSSTTVPIQRILQKSWHLKFHDLHLITKHQRCEMTVINTTRTGWLVTCGLKSSTIQNHVFDCVYVVEERAKMEQHGYTQIHNHTKMYECSKCVGDKQFQTIRKLSLIFSAVYIPS